MKRLKQKAQVLIVIFALVFVLAACGAGQQAAQDRTGHKVSAGETIAYSNGLPADQAESPTDQPDSPADQTEPPSGEPDDSDKGFFDAVFDSSQDAGKLTVRYLYLTQPMGTGSDAVTTGESSVYTSPEGLIMLIDCGNKLGGEEVVQYLKAMGVEKIDIFVMSHPHADHIGGFISIAEEFPIGRVYTNGHEYDSATYNNAMAKVKELGIPSKALAEGDSFMFGEHVEVKVYGPAPGDMEEVAAGYQDANDGSLAMRITYGKSSFWSSGDLYVSGEQKIIEKYGAELRSDVLKMNHHGKDTSNGKKFVQNMSAKIAVGMFDSIGSKTVALRFKAAGAKVFYTPCDGAIRISTAGDGTYDIQTQFLRDISFLDDHSEDGNYVIQ